ncbi:hypothetical protein [Lacticaseibacillus pantheris]|uniref:hypothetical protein n=1 Tax=Lacticaseibacillus pantheris TaxID=171523 RepID=UPI0026591A56|nr:hypothetical protein [Lacticaseibacillus pantheris]WKF86004.1 hypothetical protein QY874_05335 [Lacticaseibacillus pantheris]
MSSTEKVAEIIASIGEDVDALARSAAREVMIECKNRTFAETLQIIKAAGLVYRRTPLEDAFYHEIRMYIIRCSNTTNVDEVDIDKVLQNV